MLADPTACPPDQRALGALADDAQRHQREVLEARVCLLDLLGRHRSCQLSLASCLAMLPP